MDWTIKPYKEANHPPVAKLNHRNRFAGKSGETVTLNGESSTDPDGNTLSYQWIYYPEAGTNPSKERAGILRIPKAAGATAVAPKVAKPETMHIILAVTDNGSPALTRYQRVILTVFPKEP